MHRLAFLMFFKQLLMESSAVWCMCVCVCVCLPPLYNHLLSVHSETEQEPEEEHCDWWARPHWQKESHLGLVWGAVRCWGGGQPDGLSSPSCNTPAIHTLHSAHTLAHNKACFEQMLCGVGLEQLLSLWRRKQAGWYGRYFFSHFIFHSQLWFELSCSLSLRWVSVALCNVYIFCSLIHAGERKGFQPRVCVSAFCLMCGTELVLELAG